MRMSLSECTSLGLGGIPRAVVRLASESDLEALPDTLAALDASLPVVVLGAGSNILASDALPLIVLQPEFRQAPRILQENADEVLLEVGASVRLPALIAFCARMGLGGLEGMLGIPGSVGGAVAMNAGSYGCSMGPLLFSLRLFCAEKGLYTALADNFFYGYRKFWMNNKPEYYCMISAVLRLKKMPREAIRSRMRTCFFQKNSTQPLHTRSAGCVFANPSEDVSAGKLLDAAGFRGRVHGGVRLSPKHANFLENTGTGTAAQALELIAAARDAVHERFGVTLELEVKVWP